MVNAARCGYIGGILPLISLKHSEEKNPKYVSDCYLCPVNKHFSGEVNPDYKELFSFVNDSQTLLPEGNEEKIYNGILIAKSKTGICKVVCFSPDHSLTVPVIEVEDIIKVVQTWKKEYEELGSLPKTNYVLIFEYKVEIMGCSNAYPHGQIWSQRPIPPEILKKSDHFKDYWKAKKRGVLPAYLEQELVLKEQIVMENEHFVALVPYWAVWPYKVMIVSRKHYQDIGQLNLEEEQTFAEIPKNLWIKCDNIFETSFPYSAGIHQQPTNGELYPKWHFHMSFYPPLLRSKTIKKFIVGYELLASPQRDITADQATGTIREQSGLYYTFH